MRELDHAGRDCKDRNKYILFCRDHYLGKILKNRHYI